MQERRDQESNITRKKTRQCMCKHFLFAFFKFNTFVEMTTATSPTDSLCLNQDDFPAAAVISLLW